MWWEEGGAQGIRVRGGHRGFQAAQAVDADHYQATEDVMQAAADLDALHVQAHLEKVRIEKGG